MENKQPCFMELPTEMIGMILSDLDPASLREAEQVCFTIYEIVCTIDKRSLKLHDGHKVFSDEKIFMSMMNTSRRFREVKVHMSGKKKVDFQRLIAVAEKFSGHTKILDVKARSCLTREQFSVLLNTFSCEEELSLRIESLGTEGSDVKVKKFNKLKRLKLFSMPEPQVIIDAIPDDCLRELSIESFTSVILSDESLQSFLDRQTNLNKLELGPGRKFIINHLALKELKLSEDDDEIAAIMKHQRKLRNLTTFGVIGDNAFEVMCQLKGLEVLRTSIECVGGSSLKYLRQLRNLKELELRKRDMEEDFGEIWPGLKHLSQTELPHLVKMVLEVGLNSLDADGLAVLGNSAKNLQTLEVRSRELDFLSAFFGPYQALKKLCVFSKTNYAPNAAVPASCNTILEEIEICVSSTPHHGRPIYKQLNACPNLKRIKLQGISVFGPEVLELIQAHACLKEFTFIAATSNVIQSAVDETLTEIVKHFIRAPEFVNLRLANIRGVNGQLVRGLFGDGHRQCVVTIISEPGGTSVLMIVKHSSTGDPYMHSHPQVSKLGDEKDMNIENWN